MKKEMKYLRPVLIIVLLLVLSAGVYYFVIEKDYSGYTLKLDEKVNETLLKNGITDADVLSHTWQEKRSGFFSWIVITKEIRQPKKIRIDQLQEEITKATDALQPEISLKRDKETRTVHLYLGKDKKMLVHLVFRMDIKARLALVIDDLGYDEKKVEEFLSSGIPFSYSLFPKERYSKKIAALLQERKIPYLLHLSMEPKGYPKINPGKQALLLSMKKKEILAIVRDSLKAIGAPAGVNNHMGSAFTRERYGMHVLLSELKKQNVFFLDSVTAIDSSGEFLAKKINEPFVKNDLFLDVEDSTQATKAKCMQIVRIAKMNGSAVAIGHIHKKYLLSVLIEMQPVFEQEGIELVYLDKLLETKNTVKRLKK
ncbi:MAG: hypothetical protein A2252_11045 [Elusimicrobia bacterium RIFOXYA2_FULL_39_19]|nr:MAG: hypothetical protein A2252_11045 [Elusimicrobia bacterium RIFOXYA2_FULL_39_19]